jgi:hypothetical protein
MEIFRSLGIAEGLRQRGKKKKKNPILGGFHDAFSDIIG